MSDEKQKAAPAEPKQKKSDELTDEALDGVSGGMSNLGFVTPKVGGASSLPAQETDACITG